MNPLALIPYALAAYGGIQGYRGARDAGVGGIGSLVQGALGAYGGYSMGSAGMGMFPGSTAAQQFAKMPLTQSLTRFPGISQIPTKTVYPGMNTTGEATFASDAIRNFPSNVGDKTKSGSILDILRNKDAEGNIIKGYDPLKVGGSLAALTYLGGAFDPTPTDVYTPGYNTNYLETREKRSFSYIDPTTGEEKEYKKVYVPEQNPNDPGMMMNKQRLKTGGLAEIKKFNEGGINYLPSKMTHDEDDSNNYVRASGYVEDGAGVGDKDEDTMLAQLADGEFVTRADGVLGAGIIAGANPNSMKDMREKGAAYFYEQQKRYKRVFDLLKEANGNSKQKTN
jgi:hypothetical protein